MILHRKNELHLCVQGSHMGWRPAQELDKDDLEEEDRDSDKILTNKTVVAA